MMRVSSVFVVLASVALLAAVAQASDCQNCVKTAYWCHPSGTSSNLVGTCVSSRSACNTLSGYSVAGFKSSCPDYKSGYSTCRSCSGPYYWCKDSSYSSSGMCVGSSSNCPYSSRTVSSPSGCDDIEVAGILGMSIVLFVFVCVILPVLVVALLIWACIRCSRSSSTKVIISSPVGQQPAYQQMPPQPQFQPPPPSHYQQPPPQYQQPPPQYQQPQPQYQQPQPQYQQPQPQYQQQPQYQAQAPEYNLSPHQPDYQASH